MIKVNNLSKEFHGQGTNNELLAVDHVDFIIQDGSFCALVGESGSGKSTLAQLMCGLLVPSSGEVLFEGKIFPSAGASKSRYCDLKYS